jgi:hypothetical protein
MKKKFFNKFFVLILISLLISIIISFIFIQKYDHYQKDNITHIMLKEETFYHWWSAAKIIDQVKSGESFFSAGEEVLTKPLPQRLVAIYSWVTGYQILSDNNKNPKINLGGKLCFLIIQSFIYYLCLFYFYRIIVNFFPEKNCFYAIAFLALEPTLFLFHSSFWTESIYFSLQLLIFSLVVKKKNNYISYFLIGFLLGILFLQRSAGIFYIFVIISYYIYSLKKESIRPIFYLSLSYIFIILLLGLHNYKRSGVFYVMPTEGKYSVHRYFANDILSNSLNINSIQSEKLESELTYKWLKDNKIKLDSNLDHQKIDTSLAYRVYIKDEKERIKFYNYLNLRGYQILLEYPIQTIKNVISGYIHFSVLDPTFVYYDYEYYKDSKKIDFVYSDVHKKWIPIRVIYTILIYSLVCFGIYDFIKKKKNKNLFFIIILSVAYYYLLLGWYGKTRLFVPILIYLSIFFGNGLVFVLDKFYKKK